jgi:basic membrane lipoprotein Med (substrate-binding protein (PBP1-ABC) superfamily)
MLFSVTILLVACGNSEPEPGTSASGGGHKLKVALLVGGLTNDGDWNQVAREAVERLEKDGRVDADIREKMRDPAVSEPVIREYAVKGYDLIISHGDQMAGSIFKVAKEFPKVHFAVTGGPEELEKTTANVEVWAADPGQQGYLSGFIAGKIKDIKTVGLVEGLQLPSLLATHAAFKAGLKDADPSRQWKEAYAGSFDDAQKAVEATTALIDQGAQLIYTSGGIGQSIASAAARRQPKVLTIGVTGAASELARQINVTTVKLDMYPTYRSYVDRVANGTFGNKGYMADLANKGLVSTPLSEGVSDSRVPADLQAQVDKLIADLASGARTLPSFR